MGCVTSAAKGLAIIARKSLTMTKQLPYKIRAILDIASRNLPYKTFIWWVDEYNELAISYASKEDYLSYVESLELQPHYNEEQKYRAVHKDMEPYVLAYVTEEQELKATQQKILDVKKAIRATEELISKITPENVDELMPRYNPKED